MRVPLPLLVSTLVGPWIATANAQPIIDVGACARYEHAARAKRAALDAPEVAESAVVTLREDIAVLESALELCSDYFHLQANYLALKKNCPDAE